MSAKETEIRAVLTNRGVRYVSMVRLVEETNTLILDIPLEKVGDVAGHGMTSRRQLAHLRTALEKQFSVSVLISLRSGELLADLETGLKATLQRRFPDSVTNMALSFPSSTSADAWAFLSVSASDEEATSVGDVIKEYLEDAGFSSVNVQVSLADKPMPSLVAILRSIKISAPVSLEHLVEDVNQRGYACPSNLWLSARLDALRKRGLVVRSPSGKYTLSIEGLSSVPVSRRRSSSDIDRILALARRKQW